jgi:hypothetical protein
MKESKANRLKVWGNSMLTNCVSRLRNRRKRDASKKRRLLDKKRITE